MQPMPTAEPGVFAFTAASAPVQCGDDEAVDEQQQPRREVQQENEDEEQDEGEQSIGSKRSIASIEVPPDHALYQAALAQVEEVPEGKRVKKIKLIVVWEDDQEEQPAVQKEKEDEISDDGEIEGIL